MSGPQAHPIYSKDATVSIETGDDRFVVLQRAIDVSGFLSNVEMFFSASGKSRDAF